MILKNIDSLVETQGEVIKNKVSIDASNIDYITSLLSTNLYSHPEESFIREIVSNAWDSQVEANNTETPILITLDNNTIAIRDYGTGISPERFKEIYLNIGSSTKRESNKYIGAWGIGRFSALACSNSVCITSYYEGMKRVYIMSKGGNEVLIHEVNSEPTLEHNGVEVKINIKAADINKYFSGLEKIAFFPNIYIAQRGCWGYNMSAINNIKIKEYKNYAAIESKIYFSNVFNVLVGNVLYPCDFDVISKFRDNYQNLFTINEPLILKFNIGELDVTPNRESLLYSDKTISCLRLKMNDAIKEVKNNMKKILPQINTLYDLTVKVLNREFDFFNSSLEENTNTYNSNRTFVGYFLEVVVEKYPNIASIIKDYFPDEFPDKILAHIQGANYPKDIFKCSTNEDGTISKSVRKLYRRMRIKESDNIAILEDGIILSKKNTEYLRKKYPKTVFLKNVSEKEYASAVGHSSYLSGFIYDQIYSKLKKVNIYDEPAYEEFCKEYKEEQRENRKSKIKLEGITLRRYNSYDDRFAYSKFKNSNDIIRECKYSKKSILLIDHKEYNTRLKTFLHIVFDDKITLYSATTDVIQKLHEELADVPYIYFLEDIMNHRLVQRTLTVAKCFKEMGFKDVNTNIVVKTLRYLNYESETANNIYKLLVLENSMRCREYINNYIELFLKREDEYAKYLLSLFKEIMDKLNQVPAILERFDYIGRYQSLEADILCKILTKHKLLRVNYNAYLSFKNNPILKLL